MTTRENQLKEKLMISIATVIIFGLVIVAIVLTMFPANCEFLGNFIFSTFIYSDVEVNGWTDSNTRAWDSVIDSNNELIENNSYARWLSQFHVLVKVLIILFEIAVIVALVWLTFKMITLFCIPLYRDLQNCQRQQYLRHTHMPRRYYR